MARGGPDAAAGAGGAQAVAISCLGVSKTFTVVDAGSAWRLVLGLHGPGRRVPALSDVTFWVPKGELVGILGANGAGKSTLLRILGGLHRPDRGCIEIHGEAGGLFELGLAARPDLTGRDYAGRLLRLQGASGRALPALLADIESFSELGRRLDDPLYSYSAGMMARLFFATATAQPREVYLIDEILSVGDRHFQARCWRRLRERLGGGASGVLVTHDWSAVLRLCRQAHILERGRIVLSGPADEVVRAYLDRAGALPVAVPGIARLLGDIPASLRWRSGATARLAFGVELLRDGPVHLAFAIERLSAGRGWEILLNGVDKPVARRAGVYTAELEIPDLPLPPGRYSLDLSLVRLDPGRPAGRTLLDGRGWLKGSPIALLVDGPARAGEAVLPMRWTLAV